jgi:hypothetical protein
MKSRRKPRPAPVDGFTLTPERVPKKFVPRESSAQEKIFLHFHGRAPERRVKRTKAGLVEYYTKAIAPACDLPGADLLYATLAGVRMTVGQVAKLRRGGLRPGAPDINLDVARHGYAGLRIELKRGKGKYARADPHQIAWIKRLQTEGYFAGVCKGAEHAIETITWYLSGPRTQLMVEIEQRLDE